MAGALRHEDEGDEEGEHPYMERQRHGRPLLHLLLTPGMISRLTPNITKAGMESRSACTGVKPISLMMKVRYCCVGDGGIKTVRLVRCNSQRS